jgi:hypothetical protein
MPMMTRTITHIHFMRVKTSELSVHPPQMGAWD